MKFYLRHASVLVASMAAVLATPAMAISASAAKDFDPMAAADVLRTMPIDVPAETFRLDNGLTVVVHENHSAPLVAFNIWYHVGAKDEPKGRSGFAHLFEHLMFNGSEHFNDDFYKATQKLGATQQNGTTNADRTNYFETVPKGALDALLWLESDRMGHLLGAIDQAKLDEQRAVVKNEKRQGQNRPYSKVGDIVIAAMAPAGHPYDHSVIGSMEDLDAATLDDVRDWFRTYYGPSNAVVVLSGDITLEEARRKMEHFFGDIPPGQPVALSKSWAVPLAYDIREVAYDHVPQARFYRIWNTGDYASTDNAYLDLLGEILAGDNNSRLYKRLVVTEKLATEVGAGLDQQEIGGQFYLQVDIAPGVDPRKVEQIADEELARLIAEGPSAIELARVRSRKISAMLRGIDSIAGTAGLLAESMTFLGNSQGWRGDFDRMRTAAGADIRKAGNAWLSRGSLRLDILPFGDLKAADRGADRSAMPAVETPVARFPETERGTLPNGMKIVVVRREGAPAVDMRMIFSTGIPADYMSILPPTSEIAVALMGEGTRSRTATQLTDELALLGASIISSGGDEVSTVNLSALKPTLSQALSIYADVVRNPAYRPDDIERMKQRMLAKLDSARQDPSSSGGRVVGPILYGAASPYGRLDTATDIMAVDAAQLTAFHDRWFHPNNATLVIVGDTRLAEIAPVVEKAFAGWAPHPLPPLLGALDKVAAKPGIFLIDRPDTPQAVIRAVMAAPGFEEGDEVARDAFMAAFGGTFTARVNMKLREEKGWAYGAYSSITGQRGARLMVTRASVQTDKAAPAMMEMAKLLNDVSSKRPITAEELGVAKDNLTLGLTSQWSRNTGLVSAISTQVFYNLPDDYFTAYAGRVSALSPDAVNMAAQGFMAGQPISWIVVGDARKIESEIRALNLGDVVRINADGLPDQ